ncbi:class I SAM-dependent methyltransferase [Tahibacter soli]|uniref:Class I SAM-dependent methyltransferase n=1 Tax=Tahibacter soli TaxID=2983605 RepID=A0A9X3YPQ7_9GAMM|nr:class I SAM-dependent methyltransferase [Tahibacter soli]MDC8014446.1 class I SAM-dependent methyltransferase [Tahibacter soli]
MTAKEHWEGVYAAKASDAVSWYRPHLDLSLRWLDAIGVDAATRVIDVGGGASTLVDDLVARGLAPTVLDLSAAALDIARARLGERAARVEWVAGDVTGVALRRHGYDVWHDRAVLHFLTDPAGARAYARQLAHALRPGGHALIGGFAADGPERCSGLVVARRDPEDIAALAGPAFALRDAWFETHVTPWGSEQRFVWAWLRRDQTAVAG